MFPMSSPLNPPTSPPDMQSTLNALRESIERNTEETVQLRIVMAEHKAEQKSLESTVAKHEIALYGHGDVKGYLARFDLLEKSFTDAAKSISRAVWVIVAAALTGLGIWLLEVFRAGIIAKLGGH